jgi:hypothetical protein
MVTQCPKFYDGLKYFAMDSPKANGITGPQEILQVRASPCASALTIRPSQ